PDPIERRRHSEDAGGAKRGGALRRRAPGDRPRRVRQVLAKVDTRRAERRHRSDSRPTRLSVTFRRHATMSSPQEMPKRTDVLLLVNAMVGQFISGVATRIFVVSLPTVAAALDTDIIAVSWAVIAYQLAGICLSVVFGRLGDIHGRHFIYGGGFVVMTLS